MATPKKDSTQKTTPRKKTAKKGPARRTTVTLDAAEKKIKELKNPKTADLYIQWVRRLAIHCRCKDLNQLTIGQVEDFFKILTTEGKKFTTKRQAHAAIQTLFVGALKKDFPVFREFFSEKKEEPEAAEIPSAETIAEALTHLTDITWLQGALIYGAGLRITECTTLRVGDIDLKKRMITVRNSAGEVDRVTILPATLESPVRRHLKMRLKEFELDEATGIEPEDLPEALADENPMEWVWQHVFVSNRPRANKKGFRVRKHASISTLQKALKNACWKLDLEVPVSAHILHLAFTIHAVEAGENLREVIKRSGLSLECVARHMEKSVNEPRKMKSPIDEIYIVATPLHNLVDHAKD